MGTNFKHKQEKRVIIFENGRLSYYTFHINNAPIELVHSFKYLGVYLFKNNSLNKTQQH